MTEHRHLCLIEIGQHFAIAEALNGNTVSWMELVIDEIYRAGAGQTGRNPN